MADIDDRSQSSFDLLGRIGVDHEEQ